MRKKILTGLLVGGVVFGAVFAAAASLDVTSNKLSAGSEVVATCDDTANAEYTTTFVSAQKAFQVSTVKLTGIADTCLGQNAQAVLYDKDGVVLGKTAAAGISDGTTDVNPTDLTVTTGATGIKAELVERIDIVIADTIN